MVNRELLLSCCQRILEEEEVGFRSRVYLCLDLFVRNPFLVEEFEINNLLRQDNSMRQYPLLPPRWCSPSVPPNK